MSARLIPLGVNGLSPSPNMNRQTMSFLLLLKNQAIVLDAGTGLIRLLQPNIQKLLKPYKRLDIVLSHYHPDHTDGLTSLIQNKGEQIIRLWVPTPPLVDNGSVQAIEQLYKKPRFNVELRNFPNRIEINTYNSDKLIVGSVVIKLRRQQHGGGSVGMRISKYLAYCPDTSADKQTVAFVAGVSCLIHEAWVREGEERADELKNHTSWDQLADISAKTNIKKIMPVHFHPLWKDSDLLKLKKCIAKQAPSVEVIIPKEGEIYRI